MLNKTKHDILSKSQPDDNYPVLTAIQIAINDLGTEQVHIKKDISEIKIHRVKDSERLEKLQSTVDDATRDDELKKSIKTNIMKWLGVVPIILTLLSVIIGYMSYEAGLYQPIPPSYSANK